MKIRFTKQANDDISKVYEYIAKDNPIAAQSVLDHIEKAIDNLPTHPKIGRQGRVEKTKELIVAGTPFIVVYSLIDGFIGIIAIIHTSRQWPNTF